MHGAERVDLFRKVRYDLLPFRAFRGRNPCIVESVVDARGVGAFEHFQPAPRVEVAVGVMAIRERTRGKNTIGTRKKSAHDELVDASRAGDPDDPQSVGC